MDPIIPLLDSCCSLLRKNQQCNYSDLGFSKDVYPPIPGYADPAIAMTVLSFIFLLAIFFSLRNIFILIRKRKVLVIKQSLIMNIFVFAALTSRFAYIIDGPIQLLFESSAISPSTEISLQDASILLMISNFAYSSYIWIRNILLLHQKWSKFSLTINTLFVLDMAYIIIMIPFSNIFPFIDTPEAIILDSLLTSIGFLINGVLFSIACYSLGKNLEDIYEVYSKSTPRTKFLKILSIGVAICTLYRVFNDLFNYIFPYWQDEVKIHSFCNKTCYWSIYLFCFFVFADILPATFFLAVFSPETKGHNVIVPQSNNKKIDIDTLDILETSKTFDSIYCKVY